MRIWFNLNGKPVISYASNAVINSEGEIERIDHWVNKLWKKGGDINAKTEDKLSFLFQNGRMVQVGMYLRNQSIRDDSFTELYKKRAECEKIHGYIKDTVKFDVRKVRKQSRKLYSLMNFVAYQILMLTELKNKVKNRNSFGGHF